MKRFVVRVLLFVFPLFVMLCASEYMLRQVSNPYKYKYDWMQENADSVETLVIGSSHAFYGIRPEFLDGNTFNLANVSQNWTQDLFLLKYWSDRYKKLKTVICPVSYFSFFDCAMEDAGERFRCRYYRIYMDCDLYNSLRDRLEVSDIVTAREKMSKYLRKEAADFDRFAWGMAYKLSEKDMEDWNDTAEVEATVARHTAENDDYVDYNYSSLKGIADFCHSRNIRLVLVTTPCWRSYCERLKKEQLEKMYGLIRDLQEEYGLQYLNCLEDSDFLADDYYDFDHLSDVGAEKFTKMLNEALKME